MKREIEMKSPSVPSKGSHAAISFSFRSEPQEMTAFQLSPQWNGPLGSLSDSDRPFLHLSPSSCSNQASFHSSPELKIEFRTDTPAGSLKRPEPHPIFQSFPPCSPLHTLPPGFEGRCCWRDINYFNIFQHGASSHPENEWSFRTSPGVICREHLCNAPFILLQRCFFKNNAVFDTMLGLHLCISIYNTDLNMTI